MQCDGRRKLLPYRSHRWKPPWKPPAADPTAADILAQQKAFFAGGQTRDLQFRLDQLKILAEAILAHQEQIAAAMFADLHKPYFES